MDALGKLLLAAGLLLVAAGIAFLLVSRLGLHRLPGDIVIRRQNVTIYMPLGLMIILSLLLTILLNIFSRR